MCGITGLLDFAAPLPPDWIDPFTDALAHRGPDGRGVFQAGPVALGHRRLAILDPTPSGACPMSVRCPDGSTLVIQSDVPYAGYQDQGTRTIPARTFAGPDEQALKVVERELGDWLAGELFRGV